MSEAWIGVCSPATATGAVSLIPSSYCQPHSSTSISAIDSYYAFAEELLKVGSPDALTASPALGRLLVLGLVSSVESYLRFALSGVLRCCNHCRQHASDLVVPLGAIDYYDRSEVEFGILDRVSLASEKEIKSWTKKLWDLDIGNSSVGGHLTEFDRLCHIRHAAVHAQGRLGSANARSLGLAPEAGQHTVFVSYAGLQAAGALCHSFVRSFNVWAWKSHVARWHSSNTLSGLWKDDKEQFTQLLLLFYSERDHGSPPAPKTFYRDLPFGYRLRS